MHRPLKRTILIALFGAILAICAWIRMPLPFSPVSVTMQLFGVFLALSCLGGRDGTLAILLYLCLGALGLPLFSGFSGGVSALLGLTGGYLSGFLAIGAVYWLCEAVFHPKTLGKLLALSIGLILCYAEGTAWFFLVYTKNGSAIGVASILTLCVFPYVIPDAVKLMLAVRIAKRIRKYTRG